MARRWMAAGIGLWLGAAMALMGAPAKTENHTRASHERMGMQGGMMPLHQPVMMVYLLPKMQSELGLTSEQVSRLSTMQNNFQAQQQQAGQQIMDRQRAVDRLFAENSTDENRVRAALQDMSNLQVNEQLRAFDTARDMKGVLTKAQRAKLDKLGPDDVRAAMSRMTIGEMAGIMEVMHGPMAGGMMAHMTGHRPMSASRMERMHKHSSQ
jgi:Spy/CpxP family protein refolding chaperone